MGYFMLDGEKHLVSINIRCDNAVEKYLTAPEDKILESLKKRLYISLAERGDSRFWLITRARMSNEHGKSFEGEYKAKLREGAYDYQDLVTVSDIIENNESPEIDVCLSEFISSGFNFKILEQWDRTKKS